MNQPKQTAVVAVEPRADVDPAILVQVLGRGDIKNLTDMQRVDYLQALCRSLRLNPLSQPFSIGDIKGKTVIYARKDAAEQLRYRDQVSVEIVSREFDHGCYIVVAKASLPNGRFDTATGAVPIAENASADEYAKALKVAETQAKRRATLSICGLGIPDESEMDAAPRAGGRELPPRQLPPRTQAASKPLANPTNAARVAENVARDANAKATGLGGEVVEDEAAVEATAALPRFDGTDAPHASIVEHARKILLCANTVAAKLGDDRELVDGIAKIASRLPKLKSKAGFSAQRYMEHLETLAGGQQPAEGMATEKDYAAQRAVAEELVNMSAEELKK